MNKHGWGLRMELFFILLFIACLIFATLGLSKFGLVESDDNLDLFGNPKNTQMYLDFENNLSKAALNYYNNKYSSASDVIIIEADTLYNTGYLSRMYDNDGDECYGYAKVYPNKNVLSYIKCDKYKTDGYNKNHE